MLAAIALSACSAGSPRPVSPRGTPSIGASTAATWRFDVTGNPGANELTIEAVFPAGTPATLGFESDATRFVTDVHLATNDGWRPLALARGAITAPECASGGCRIRYHYLLAEAARAIADVDTAMAAGDAIEAPPSTWLLHPNDVAPAGYRLHVAASVGFVSPLPPAVDGTADTYEAHDAGLEITPFAGLGTACACARSPSANRFSRSELRQPRALDDDAIVAWITHAAEGIAAYYGHYPSAAPLFLVLPDEGTSTDGKTLGNGGASTILRIGPRVTPALAREGWVATHEMIHLNFPSFGYPHSWLEEGIATYVEPIVRVRAGVIAPDALWHDLVKQGADGLPKAGDEGLERTHTWGRDLLGARSSAFWPTSRSVHGRRTHGRSTTRFGR